MTLPNYEEIMREVEVSQAARADAMPTEQDAINMMFAAHQRLRELGWRDAMYGPKDGTVVDAISPGSTGIHPTHYMGEWPKGGWWAHDGGDLWPSDPSLIRPRTKAESENSAPKSENSEGD